ncbi:MAG: hypothetical protein LUC85_11095 [Bacteroidales bacterium]|nr:hypothetical protein [Bacteroidales bacterium]MCD8395351.1 hypothetical protein [Bacteroidales bacterium]
MRRWLSILSLCLALCARAQWSFDVSSVEAYIADHKSQRSLLLARATLEQSNNILHEYSATAAKEYKELNFDLDKYTRAFDVIDVLYQSLRTALNVTSTYRNVTETLGKYRNLLEDYKSAVERHGVQMTDTIIYHISYRGIANIASEAQNLYHSVSDLVLYATGAAACSTSNLMLVLECINQSLDHIEATVNRCYFDTWRYIQVRKGYWKRSVYIFQTRREIVEGALRRWLDSGYKPLNPEEE